MQYIPHLKSIYLNRKGWKNYVKSRKRFHRNRIRKIKKLRLYGENEKPKLSENVLWINEKLKDVLDKNIFRNRKNVVTLEVPRIFSLIENEQESFYFIQGLLSRLNNKDCKRLMVDYRNCESIDLDASVYMDVLLQDFISFYHKCEDKGFKIPIKTIIPENLKKNQIENFYFQLAHFLIQLGSQEITKIL